MRSFLLITFVVFLGFVVSLFLKSGAWKPVRISESQLGPYSMIYKDYVGPYHKIVSTIQEVESWAKEKGIKCSQTFGEYIDDPAIVEHDRLRSRGGCIVDQIPGPLPEGMKSMDIPQRRYVMGEFSGSPALGPLKVYGKMTAYLESHRLKSSSAVLEIYEVTNETEVLTRYLFALENQPELENQP